MCVAAILEGSVRRAGQRIRVTAQLVDATTGYHEWSQTYDRQFTDIFKLQDDLAAAIVQALQANMGVVGVGSLGRVGFIMDFVALDALDPAYDLVNRHIDDVVRTGIGGGASWSFLWGPEMRAFRKDT